MKPMIPSLENPRWVSAAARAALLGVLLLAAACDHRRADSGARPGSFLPDVVLNTLAGVPAASTRELLGRPLVINIWATWCRPCREEMPSLERLSQRISAQGVRVIGITLDDDRNLATEFLHARGLTFPVYGAGDSIQFQSMMGVKSLPETLLVRADGTVAARVSGARDWTSTETGTLLEDALTVRLAHRLEDRDAPGANTPGKTGE